ncbi:hypothetical protein BST81_10120 [Leptolyngbya sp. 'hensonii']|uniref:nucleotidyltransferase domain-containing protein n=1 Tax=Leptolyngbya sp. 'hensonii' TaxID=1922337 RepID=UPI00094FDDA5|nr:nucleotidyltransferase family protein [Leptolyngbya sp. 'hensonii']OLP18631.1 hypothetical protein BST81_10120 [Leptolyngbya sp. 'hensonii']
MMMDVLPAAITSEDSTRQWVIRCLQGRLAPQTLAATRYLLAQSNLDWNRFLQLAQGEAVAPLLFQALRGQAIVPAWVEAQLEAAYYRNACRNALLLHELAAVLQALARVGIEVIVLKGVALAELVYRDIGVRPMSDLDLLIRSTDVGRARHILADLGYTPLDLEMQAGYTEEFRNEATFGKQGLTEICIDLHWRLFSPLYYQRRLTADWFWQTRLPIQINQVTAFAFGPEAQLLHLCAHLSLHHQGEGLLWQHDIAEVLLYYRQQIDWTVLLQQARTFDLVLSLQQVLLSVTQNWDLTLPPEVWQGLQDLSPSPREVSVLGWLRAPHLRSSLRCFLADLSVAAGWRERLHLMWNMLFPTRAYMQRRYQITHPLLIPLYYTYRVLLGLRRESRE